MYEKYEIFSFYDYYGFIMEPTASNPYQAPESDVSNVDSSDAVMNFNRFTAWAVFGLGFITGGIYTMYWLVTRVSKLNGFYESKIPMFMAYLIPISFVAMYIVPAIFGASIGGILALVFTVAYIVSYLYVVFAFASRIRTMTGLPVNGFITFFGGPIYLQYKINEAIDKHKFLFVRAAKP